MNSMDEEKELAAADSESVNEQQGIESPTEPIAVVELMLTDQSSQPLAATGTTPGHSKATPAADFHLSLLQCQNFQCKAEL